MTTLQRIIWRLFAADVSVTLIWLLIGGSAIVPIAIFLLHVICLWGIEGMVEGAREIRGILRGRRGWRDGRGDGVCAGGQGGGAEAPGESKSRQ